MSYVSPAKVTYTDVFAYLVAEVPRFVSSISVQSRPDGGNDSGAGGGNSAAGQKPAAKSGSIRSISRDQFAIYLNASILPVFWKQLSRKQVTATSYLLYSAF